MLTNSSYQQSQLYAYKKNANFKSELPRNYIVLASQKIFDEAFKDLSEKNWHFLFMDRHTWKSIKPPVVDFEVFNEIGYLNALHQTLKKVIRTQIGLKYDAEYLRALRESCIEGVIKEGKPFEKGFSSGWYYAFNTTNMSNEARHELKSKKIHNCSSDPDPQGEFLSYGNFENYCDYEALKVKSFFRNPSQLNQVIDKLNDQFDAYYNSIASSKSNDEKLAAIADLCRAIEMIHVFPDGNGRTITFALLYKLLIENGFSPAIISNPHKTFTGYSSTKEMVNLLKEGMDNYQMLIEQLKELKETSNCLTNTLTASERLIEMLLNFLTWVS